jgi:hypothetical protein
MVCSQILVDFDAWKQQNIGRFTIAGCATWVDERCRGVVSQV